MKILVLLESPSKIEKIKHILEDLYPENDYTVLASGGHITKISNSGPWRLGINWETVEPIFTTDKSKAKNVNAIKKAGKKVDLIILATDPDREGEAISWHLYNLFTKSKAEIKRSTFNEITKDGISNAFSNLKDIDMNLVNAQLTRQMLDKIIGFLVSKSLQKATGLISAGRVQTPGLNILTVRDQLIKNFTKIKYSEIFIKENKKNILLSLKKDKNNVSINSEKTYYLSDEKEIKKIIDELDTKYNCTDYKKVKYHTRHYKPYSTAGLLQDGFSKLKLSAAQISIAAQKLYEQGLITYIRTDSIKYSNEFIENAKTYISSNFSEDLFEEPIKGKKDSTAQEAHESIRPTDLSLTPADASEKIEDKNQKRVYRMIWWNTIKSLMKGPSGFNHRWVFSNNGYEFRQSWQEIIDLGYNKLQESLTKDDIIFNEDGEAIIEKNEAKPDFEFKNNFTLEISKKNIVLEENETNPPAMYNQASLIKELKNLGIGRPSTYSPILVKLKDRNYVEYPKGKPIIVTDKGYEANDFLYEYYSEFFNWNYSANMEKMLDDISTGQNTTYKEWIRELFISLSKKVESIIENVSTIDIKCPKCKDGKLVYIRAFFNRGRGCSNFVTTKCGYREYEQPDGSWLEYVPKEKEEKK